MLYDRHLSKAGRKFYLKVYLVLWKSNMYNLYKMDTRRKWKELIATSAL